MKARIQFVLRLFIIFMLIISIGCSSSSSDNTANDTDAVTEEGGDSSSEDDTTEEEGDDSSSDEDSVLGYFLPDDNFLLVYTDDAQIPFFATMEDGNTIAPIVETDESSDIIGAILLTPDNESIVTYLGENGLPEVATVENTTIVFSNYTDNTVDITIYDQNNTITKQRNISIDSDSIAFLSDQNGNSNTARTARTDKVIDDVVNSLKITDAIINVSTVAIYFASTVGIIALSPAMAVAVEAYIATTAVSYVLNKLIDKYATDIKADPDVVSFYKTWLGCFSGALGCVTSIMEKLQDTLKGTDKDIDDVVEYLLSGIIEFFSSGDPHLCTVDGVHYDFQALGEFVYLESTIDPSEMTVQVRQESYYSSLYVAMNTAVAISVVGDVIEIYTTSEKYESPLYINHEPQDVSETDTWDLPNGGQVILDDSRYFIIWPDSSQIQVRRVGGGARLNVQGYLAEARQNSIQGLVGNYDGDASNDLTTRDGIMTLDIASKLTKEELYDEFGNSWRILQEESLFSYADGEDTSTYTNLDYPYQIVTADDLDEETYSNAEQICTDAGITDSILLEDCILDVGLTGDSDFAEEYNYLKSPTEDVEVTVEESAQAITGTITDEQENLLSDIKVKLQLIDETTEVYSNQDGVFFMKIPYDNLPDYFVVSASDADYVPSVTDIIKPDNEEGNTTYTVDFTLEELSDDVVVLESEPSVHHLGDDNYSGTENSYFQQETEGTVYSQDFNISDTHLNFSQAKISLLAKGLQFDNPLTINDNLIDVLNSSPSDGSFGQVELSFDVSLLQSGVNTLEIESFQSGDFDDFEFINVIIRFEE